MAAPTINLANYKPTTSVGGISLPTGSTAKSQYTASLSPTATLNLTNPAGLPPTPGITNKNVLPDYLRNGSSSNGATAPTPTKIAPATTTPASTGSSLGSYKGVAINPGDDASVAAQIAAIDGGGSSLGSPSAQSYISSIGGSPAGSASPTPFGSTGNGSTTGGTTNTPQTPAQPSAYDTAMNAYLDALKGSQDINAKVQAETLAGNHAVQEDLDRSGGLLQGNQASAALDARRSNASLADLGVAETSATNASNLALERLKYEQGNLPSNDPYTLSPGQARYDASGKLIASLPDNGSNEPTSVQEYQFAQAQGYTGSYEDFKNSGGAASDPNRVLSAAEAQSLGVPYGTTALQAYGITPSKPLTEAQAKDVTYGQRGSQANDILNGLQDTIVKYNPATFAAYSTIEPNTIGNALVPDDIRQIRQAERNFATAVLRRESGASISASEFATLDKQYFPQPGDDAKTLAQKTQNRTTAINSFLANAGSGGYNAGGGSTSTSTSGFGWNG